MPRRPKTITIGKVSVRVHRGPREDGRWYWRADRQMGAGRDKLWHGWGTPAEAEATVIAVLASRGEAGGVRRDVQVRTVHDLVDTWAASQLARKDISDHTRTAARTAAARISGVIGEVLLERVDRRTIERLRDQSGDAGSTVARTLKYLRQAWRWGREVGVVPDRELPGGVRVQRQDPVRSTYTPTRGDVAALLVEVRRYSEGAYRGVVLIGATGARPGEACSLPWGRVARDHRSAELVGKSGRRVVELHPEVTAELRRWDDVRRAPLRSAAEWLAAAQAAGDEALVEHLTAVLASMEAALRDELVVGVTDETVRWQLRQAADALGLPRVTPTALRRYVTDALYDTGALPDVESAIVGHSPEIAQRIYRDRRRSAAQRRAVLAAGLGIPGVEGGDVIDLEDAAGRRRR